MVSKFNCAAVVFFLFGARGRLKRSRSERRCVVGSTSNPQRSQRHHGSCHLAGVDMNKGKKHPNSLGFSAASSTKGLNRGISSDLNRDKPGLRVEKKMEGEVVERTETSRMGKELARGGTSTDCTKFTVEL